MISRKIRGKFVKVITFQQNTEVRGIEKTIKDLGHNTEILMADIDKILKTLDKTHMYVIAIPEEIMSDSVEQEVLEEIIDSILNKNKYLIVLGNKSFHNGLLKIIPEIKLAHWINRPLKLEEVSDTVNKIFRLEVKMKETKKILIVDDDPSYAKTVREWLKDTYSISIVTAGMQAITFLMQNQIDLVLLDYAMPVVDGPQILEMLRSDTITANIPVVFLTGVGTKESITRAMSLKPQGYILKTATKEELLKSLETIFEKLYASECK